MVDLARGRVGRLISRSLDVSIGFCPLGDRGAAARTLGAVVQRAQTQCNGKAQYLFIAEDTTSERMRDCVDSHKGLLPEGRRYHDTQGQLRDAPHPGLPGGEVKLPTP